MSWCWGNGTSAICWRITPVAFRPGEGPLTKRTAGVQPASREQVFMPHKRPPRSAWDWPSWVVTGHSPATHRDGEDAPIPVILMTVIEHRGRTQSGNCPSALSGTPSPKSADRYADHDQGCRLGSGTITRNLLRCWQRSRLSSRVGDVR